MSPSPWKKVPFGIFTKTFCWILNSGEYLVRCNSLTLHLGKQFFKVVLGRFKVLQQWYQTNFQWRPHHSRSGPQRGLVGLVHLYSSKITFGPLKTTMRLVWHQVKMRLTPLRYSVKDGNLLSVFSMAENPGAVCATSTIYGSIGFCKSLFEVCFAVYTLPLSGDNVHYLVLC